jgi:glycosyltransferase involved in cell wall biosynthesis
VTVVFDLVAVQNRDHGERGIARYTLQLALEVERQAPGLVDRWLLRRHLPVPGLLEPVLSTGRVRTFDGDRRDVDVRAGGVYLAGSLFELEQRTETVLPRIFRDPAWHRMAVLYDLIPSHYPERYLTRYEIRNEYHARIDALRAMHHVLAISETTRDDAKALLGIPPERVSVIGAGADDRFAHHPGGRAAAQADVVARPPAEGLRGGYVLFPSGLDPRKNIDGMLEAYARLPAELRAQHQLVLVFKVTDLQKAELRDQAWRMGILDDVCITGFVSDEDLVRLYQGAELVVFPSLYEGFGLPVLEAMRCGAPVICSDASSLREVQLEASARFDPADPAAIAAVMERVLRDPAERERIAELEPPPFSWALAAEETIRQIEAGVRASQRRARPRRPRVALLSPMPPMRSGIATYAGRVVEHLRHHVDVTAFVDFDEATVTPVPGVEVRSTRDLEGIDAAGRPFDRVVTFLGNSTFHVESLEVLKRVGGTVLLHDARLSGLYGEVQRLHPKRLVRRSVGRTLGALYPERYRALVEAQDVIPPDLAYLSGVHLLAEVVDAAHQVLVHSAYAADLTELDTGVRPEVVFPIPCAPPQTRAASIDEDHVVSVGIVSPTKGAELLVDAAAALRRRRPRARLTFVGGVTDEYRDELLARAEAVGAGGAVALTGHLPDDEYASVLSRATCAVQLRAFTNGESSAAVMDALSAGLPTVVTALGAMAELPDDVVVGVRPGASAEEVAGVLADLLEDAERRERLTERAHAHAAANTYEAAALRLLDAIDLHP